MFTQHIEVFTLSNIPLSGLNHNQISNIILTSFKFLKLRIKNKTANNNYYHKVTKYAWILLLTIGVPEGTNVYQEAISNLDIPVSNTTIIIPYFNIPEESQNRQDYELICKFQENDRFDICIFIYDSVEKKYKEYQRRIVYWSAFVSKRQQSKINKILQLSTQMGNRETNW